MTGEGGEGEGEENCHMLITSPLNEGGRDKKKREKQKSEDNRKRKGASEQQAQKRRLINRQ